MSPFEVFLFYTFIITGIINTFHLGLYIGGANIYDIIQFRRRAQLKKRAARKLPLVSIVIPAHNERLSIIRGLESIRKSSYRKLEVIVHDDCSTDETAQLIRDYQKKVSQVCPALG